MLARQGAGELPSYLSDHFLKVQLLLDREGGGRAAPQLLVPSDPSFSSPWGSEAYFSLSSDEGNMCSVLVGTTQGAGPWSQSPASCLSLSGCCKGADGLETNIYSSHFYSLGGPGPGMRQIQCPVGLISWFSDDTFPLCPPKSGESCLGGVLL